MYSHHFSLLSLTSLLSAPEREVTSPSDFKVVGALYPAHFFTANKNHVHDKPTRHWINLINIIDHYFQG